MKSVDFFKAGEKTSLQEKVFEKLQEDILMGKLQAGDSITELAISNELGLSRTPVREAIRRLESEGLVQYIPNKGAIVIGISEQEILDIYTIREMIEGLAVRWAVPKITQEEVEELRDTVELMEFYTKKNNVDLLKMLDSHFHEVIFQACKSLPINHTLKNFHGYSIRARKLCYENPERAQLALEEHKGIYHAVEERDAKKAEELLKQHIRNSSTYYLKFLRERMQGN
jgi:DNA-binding GntR family transcriptional regulator